jgi:hypothetical protein
MSIVTIEQERGEPAQRLDFIAWKADRRAFYARPHNGKPRVVTLTPAMPDEAVFVDELGRATDTPFPECSPERIVPCRLLPPPCRETAQEWETVLPEKWEAVYAKTHGQVLYLTPEDYKPLQERLDRWLEKRVKQSERDYADRSAQIKAIQTRIVEEGDEERRLKLEKELGEAEQQRSLIVSGEQEPFDYAGEKFAGELKITLDMVKRGCGELPGQLPGRECIRDDYLVGWWTRHERFDLAEMDRQRAKFRKWVEARAAFPANIQSGTMKDLRRGLVPPFFSRHRDPRFLTLCAGVCFRVEFADGSAAYLTGCEVREEPRADEWKELKREHEIETAHARRVRKGRRRGGKRSCKVSKDPQAKKAIGDEVRRFYAAMKGARSKKKAGETGARFAERRFKVKISYRTALTYAEQTGGVEAGKH